MTIQKTGIIRTVRIGKVDHSDNLTGIFKIDMNGTDFYLITSMDDVKTMMNDSKIYDDVLGLIGQPCEILVDEKNRCDFLGMWKQ